MQYSSSSIPIFNSKQIDILDKKKQIGNSTISR